jgi:Fe/S biogenesis protein NfuA
MTTTSTDQVIEITQAALDQIMALREQESIPELHLGLRISGVGNAGFIYETAFLRAEDVGEGDHIEHHGDLPVAIPPDSIDNLRGSVLDLSADPSNAGLVLRNPNPATPDIAAPDYGEIELEGSVSERVTQLLDRYINPSIAAHGGWASLISVDGETAYLELGGGCQGCGLAAMTLRQGIETAILHNVPEITEVVDVTDHSAGVNPYY